MLLIVLTGDDAVVAKEPRSLLAREDADDERRKVVLSVLGEKREVMDWKREDCILNENEMFPTLFYV